MRSAFARVVLLCVAAMLPACGDLNVASQPIAANSALITQADTRVISTTQASLDPLGKNRPAQITCAEPSPDIAKAVDKAFGAGGNVTFNINGAQPTSDQVVQIAAAVSRSRSEAVAQLGERLASIQLLRDGLYRACEAYQNGALSPISYALVLSRYGDTLVTLLGSELIAGEFGRSGAAIGGSASASANATTAQETAEAAKTANAQVVTAQQNLSAKIAAEDKAKASLDKANSDLGAATGDRVAAAQTQVASAQKGLSDAAADTDQARRDLDTARAAAAGAKSAAATAAASGGGTGIGGLTRSPNEQGVNRIADLVRGYIQAPNIHPVMTACIAVLEDNWRGNTAFGQFCIENMPKFVDILRAASAKSAEGLAATSADAEYRYFSDRVTRLQNVLGRVKATVNSPPPPPKPAPPPR